AHSLSDFYELYIKNLLSVMTIKRHQPTKK
ncbi:MAG: hypothetical protein ACJARP_003249, partial [Vicingaceae bacterium]